MEWINPKTALEGLILSQLQSLFENTDSSPLHLGISEGDINFTDLLFKRKSIPVSDNIVITLEYGHIGQLNCQVPYPWAARPACINIDDLQIVFRLHSKDMSQVLKELSSKQVSATSKDGEGNGKDDGGKSLLEQPEMYKNWFSQITESMLFSWLSSIITNFSLKLSNVRISILVPTVKLGDKVEAYHKTRAQWCSGVVAKVNENGTYDVTFDGGSNNNTGPTTTHHNLHEDHVRFISSIKKDFSAPPEESGSSHSHHKLISRSSEIRIACSDFCIESCKQPTISKATSNEEKKSFDTNPSHGYSTPSRHSFTQDKTKDNPSSASGSFSTISSNKTPIKKLDKMPPGGASSAGAISQLTVNKKDIKMRGFSVAINTVNTPKSILECRRFAERWFDASNSGPGIVLNPVMLEAEISLTNFDALLKLVFSNTLNMQEFFDSVNNDRGKFLTFCLNVSNIELSPSFTQINLVHAMLMSLSTLNHSDIPQEIVNANVAEILKARREEDKAAAAAAAALATPRQVPTAGGGSKGNNSIANNSSSSSSNPIAATINRFDLPCFLDNIYNSCHVELMISRLACSVLISDKYLSSVADQKESQKMQHAQNSNFSPVAGSRHPQHTIPQAHGVSSDNTSVISLLSLGLYGFYFGYSCSKKSCCGYFSSIENVKTKDEVLVKAEWDDSNCRNDVFIFDSKDKSSAKFFKVKKELLVTLGSLRMYGEQGFEMIACGGDPDYWQDEARKGDSVAEEMVALDVSYNYQYFIDVEGNHMPFDRDSYNYYNNSSSSNNSSGSDGGAGIRGNNGNNFQDIQDMVQEKIKKFSPKKVIRPDSAKINCNYEIILYPELTINLDRIHVNWDLEANISLKSLAYTAYKIYKLDSKQAIEQNKKMSFVISYYFHNLCFNFTSNGLMLNVTIEDLNDEEKHIRKSPDHDIICLKVESIVLFGGPSLLDKLESSYNVEKMSMANDGFDDAAGGSSSNLAPPYDSAHDGYNHSNAQTPRKGEKTNSNSNSSNNLSDSLHSFSMNYVRYYNSSKTNIRPMCGHLSTIDILIYRKIATSRARSSSDYFKRSLFLHPLDLKLFCTLSKSNPPLSTEIIKSFQDLSTTGKNIQAVMNENLPSRMRIDIECNDFIVNLSKQNLYSFINLSEEIDLLMTSGNELDSDDSAGNREINSSRDETDINTCDMVVNVSVSQAIVSFSSDSNDFALDKHISALLSDYIDKIQDRSLKSSYALCLNRLTLRKLQGLGCPFNVASAVLADHKLRDNLVVNTRKIIESLVIVNGGVQHKASLPTENQIISFDLKNLILHATFLRYDALRAVSFTSFSICDHTMSPIFFIRDSFAEEINNSDPSMALSGKDKVLREVDSIYFQYKTIDNPIKEKLMQNDFFFCIFKDNFHISLNEVGLVANHKNLLELLELCDSNLSTINEYKVRHKKKSQSSKNKINLSPIKKVNNTEFFQNRSEISNVLRCNINCKSIEVVFSFGNHLLSSLIFSKLNFNTDIVIFCNDEIKVQYLNLIISSMRLEDLSKGGSHHSQIIWKNNNYNAQGTSIGTPTGTSSEIPMLDFEFSQTQSEIRINLKGSDVKFNYVNRFVIELIEYINFYLEGGSVYKQFNLFLSERINMKDTKTIDNADLEEIDRDIMFISQKGKSGMKTKYKKITILHASFNNFAFLAPRNSKSFDLACLQAKEISVCSFYRKESFSLPGELTGASISPKNADQRFAEEIDVTQTIYFDSVSNSWMNHASTSPQMYSPTGSSNYSYSPSVNGSNFPFHTEQVEKFDDSSSDGNGEDTSSDCKDADNFYDAVSLISSNEVRYCKFNISAFNPDRAFGEFRKGDKVVSNFRYRGLLRRWHYGTIIDILGDAEYDVLCDDGMTEKNVPIIMLAKKRPPSHVSSSSFYFDDDDEEHLQFEMFYDHHPVQRLSVGVSNADLFITIANPLTHFEHENAYDQHLFETVLDESYVFVNPRDLKNSQKWKKVSNTPFNLLVVRDDILTKIESASKSAQSMPESAFLPGSKDTPVVEISESVTTKSIIRSLVTETDTPSYLNLKLSMAELYLLQSLWFDNMSEMELFFSDELALRDRTESYKHNENANFKLFENFGAYGSIQYLKNLKNYFKTGIKTETCLVLSKLVIEASMDVNYFLVDPPALSLLLDYCAKYQKHDKHEKHENYMEQNQVFKSNLRNDFESTRARSGAMPHQYLWNRIVCPFATISLSGIVLNVQAGAEAIQVALGAISGEVTDNRFPIIVPEKKILVFPHTLSSKSNSRLYGVADLGFSLNLSPSHLSPELDRKLNFVDGKAVKLGKASSIMFSYYYTAQSNWGNSNVLIDLPGLALNDLDMVYIVSDYFSCYYQYPAFGNVTILKKCPKGCEDKYGKLYEIYKRPKDVDEIIDKLYNQYGGIDVRAFISRPLISVIETKPFKNSKTLIFESDQGAYYRYMVDKDLSIRQELQVFEGALNLAKRYMPIQKDLTRLGDNVKTLAEHFSIGLVYDYFATSNRMDISFNISNSFNPMHKKNMDYENAEHEQFSYESASKSDDIKDFNTSKNVSSDSEDAKMEFVAVEMIKQPLIIPYPKTVFPLSSPESISPPISCHIIFSYEDLVDVCRIIKKFLGFENGSHIKESASSNQAPADNLNKFIQIYLSGIRAVHVDNVLGLHLPLIQCVIETLHLNYDRSFNNKIDQAANESKANSSEPTISETLTGRNRMERTRSLNRGDVLLLNQRSDMRQSLNHEDSFKGGENKVRLDDSSNDISLCFGNVVFLADYFNNLNKCWEPFVERLDVSCLREFGSRRGSGLTVRSTSAVHANLSGNIIRIFSEIYSTVNNVNNAKDDEDDFEYDLNHEKKQSNSNVNDDNSIDEVDDSNKRKGALRKVLIAGTIVDQSKQKSSASRLSGDLLAIESKPSEKMQHFQATNLSPNSKVGFSILNLTGQPLRYLQQNIDGRRSIQYMNNNERAVLNFLASVSKIRDNETIEETIDLQVSHDNRFNGDESKSIKHVITLQLLGYEWITDINTDLVSKYNELNPIEDTASLSGLNAMSPTHASSLSNRESSFAESNSDSNADMWKITNALRLLSEVQGYKGGRLVQLRSVFAVKNNTDHAIHLFCRAAARSWDVRISSVKGLDDTKDANKEYNNFDGNPYILESGATFYVPIALLRKSVLLASEAKQSISTKDVGLGWLFVRPADKGETGPAARELKCREAANYVGLSSNKLDKVDYCREPLCLSKVVDATADLFKTSYEKYQNTAISGEDLDHQSLQLSCQMITKVSKSQKRDSDRTFQGGVEKANSMNLAYNIEIQRKGLLHVKDDKESVAEKTSKFAFSNSKNDKSGPLTHQPVHYLISIHPPIILENLLPTGGEFQIVNVNKTVLWSSWIESGKAIPIHTLSLEGKLTLTINLKYARSSDGVVIHDSESNASKDIASKVKGIFIDEDQERNIGKMQIVLTDTCSQRLVLNVDNIKGKGKERLITVYSPYWIVNCSQHALLIKEDGSNELPAGTFTPQNDGTAPVSTFREDQYLKAGHNPHAKTVFPGKNGPIHKLNIFTTDDEGKIRYGEIQNNDSDKTKYIQGLAFSDVIDLAYMYNFTDNSRLLGTKKVVVKLDNSEWSHPLSLDSVGVNQIVSIYDNENPTSEAFGLYQAVLKISNAPGRLGGYTKIVTFLPKFVIINKLNYDINVKQPIGFDRFMFVDNKFGSFTSGHMRPFHMPNAHADRVIQISIVDPDPNQEWNDSFSIPVDTMSSFSFYVKKKEDNSDRPYFNTRINTEYDVLCKTNDALHIPTSELGIFFETDWMEQNIIVKGFKNGCFARTSQIQIGDVLKEILDINDKHVLIKPELTQDKKKRDDRFRVNFEAVMDILKKCLNENGCILRFMTKEEKFRLIRKAKSSSDKKGEKKFRKVALKPAGEVAEEKSDVSQEICVKLDFKLNEEHCSLIILEPIENPNTEPEYKICNKSAFVLNYKQKGILGNPWNTLKPGEETWFMWEDYFKPHRLMIQVGYSILNPNAEIERENNLPFVMVVATDDIPDSIIEVELDEIGSKKPIPVPESKATLFAEVKSQGSTKSLIIAPDYDLRMAELTYCKEFSKAFIRELKVFIEMIEFVHNTSTRYSGKHTHFERPGEESESAKDENRMKVLTPTSSQSFSRSSSTFQEPNWELLLKTYMDNFRAIEQTLATKQEELLESLNKYDVKRGKEDDSSIFLTTYAPIKNIFRKNITEPNQLVIDIFECREVPPLVRGKMEDVYCLVYLKINETKIDQKQTTYTCTQTLNPVWMDQRFIFNLPHLQEEESRSYVLVVEIKKKNYFSIDTILGHTEVHFTSLQPVLHNSDVVYKVLGGESGSSDWLPIISNSNVSQDITNSTVQGSIRLRITWINETKGLPNFLYKSACERKQELESFVKVIDELKKQEEKERHHNFSSWQHNSDIQNYGLADGNYTAQAFKEGGMELLKLGWQAGAQLAKGGVGLMKKGVEMGAHIIGFDNDNNNSNNNNSNNSIISSNNQNSNKKPSHELFSTFDGERVYGRDEIFAKQSSIALYDDSLFASNIDVNNATRTISSILSGEPDLSDLSRADVRTISCDILRSSFYYYNKKFLENLSALQRSERFQFQNFSFTRSIDMYNDNLKFTSRCLEECERNFNQVRLEKVTLYVTPIQALHLSDLKGTYLDAWRSHKLRVNMSYGNQKHHTYSIPPAADLCWYKDETQQAGFQGVGSIAEDEIDEATAENTPESSLNDTLTAKFHIDTMNIQGNIRIRISTDDIIHQMRKDVAQLDLPVLNLLECLRSDGKDKSGKLVYVYEKYFPLLLTSECLPGEGEMGNINSKLISHEQDEQEKHKYFGHRKPCIKLRIKATKEEEKNPLDKERETSSSDATLVDDDIKFEEYSRLQLPSFSISFLDVDKYQEVMLLSLNDLDARYSKTSNFTDFLLNLMWAQVDNELPDCTDSTVILTPTQVKYQQPVLRLRTRENNTHYTDDLTSFESVEVVLQELDLKLEQKTILSLYDLYVSFSKGFDVKDSNSKELFKASSSILNLGYNIKDIKTDEKSVELLEMTKEKNDEMGKRFYIKYLFVGPIKVNTTFLSSSLFDDESTVNKLPTIGNNPINWLGLGAILKSVFSFIQEVGHIVLKMTSSISNSPLIFNTYEKKHVHSYKYAIVNALVKHYSQLTLQQLYKLVISLDLVGNPLGFATSIGVGVKDFFYEPAHALITNPKDVKKVLGSLSKGVVSIFTTTTDGLISSGTSFTKSVSEGILKLTFDPDYIRKRDELQRAPNSILESSTRPFRDVINGLYCGARGLVTLPTNAFNTKNASCGKKLILVPIGFIKGVIGLPFKAMVGVLDAITHTGDAVRAVVKQSTTTTIAKKPLHRLRLSNLFGIDGRVLPYKTSNAFGTYIKRYLDSVLKFEEEADIKGETSAEGGQHDKMMPVRGGALRKNALSQERDYAIHTTILNESPGCDSVIIVTTKRLLITQYLRKTKGAEIKLVWWCYTENIFGLQPLKYSHNGRLAVEFDERYLDDANTVHREISALPEHAERLNTLVHVLVASSSLRSREFSFDARNKYNYYDTYECFDVDDVIHVGPWQYLFGDNPKPKNDPALATPAIDEYRNASWNIAPKKGQINTIPINSMSEQPLSPTDWLEAEINEYFAKHEASIAKHLASKRRSLYQETTKGKEVSNSNKTIAKEEDWFPIVSNPHSGFSLEDLIAEGRDEHSSLFDSIPEYVTTRDNKSKLKVETLEDHLASSISQDWTTYVSPSRPFDKSIIAFERSGSSSTLKSHTTSTASARPSLSAADFNGGKRASGDGLGAFVDDLSRESSVFGGSDLGGGDVSSPKQQENVRRSLSPSSSSNSNSNSSSNNNANYNNYSGSVNRNIFGNNINSQDSSPNSNSTLE